ncbi:MAG: DUF2089 family protein [Phycisphaerales bacterium]|nr:DUF2089 family protein [Phycisphaerales bacterium]
MAFNFPNGVPKFPAGVKSEKISSLVSASMQAAAGDHTIWGPAPHPLASLPRDDQDLIVQLVLHSGSLKELAAAYDVSYPTIRIRVDRVIERLRVIVAGRKPDGVGELLAEMVGRGEVSSEAARQIGEAVRKHLEQAVR